MLWDRPCRGEHIYTYICDIYVYLNMIYVYACIYMIYDICTDTYDICMYINIIYHIYEYYQPKQGTIVFRETPSKKSPIDFYASSLLSWDASRKDR